MYSLKVLQFSLFQLLLFKNILFLISAITIQIDRWKLHYLFSLVLRFPDKIGGGLPGVHYIRDVADADSLISSLVVHPFLHAVHIHLHTASLCEFLSPEATLYFLQLQLTSISFPGESKKGGCCWWWLYWYGGRCSSCWLETWYNSMDSFIAWLLFTLVACYLG